MAASRAPIDAGGRRATPRPRRGGGERHARPRPRLLLRRDRGSGAARAAGQRLVRAWPTPPPPLGATQLTVVECRNASVPLYADNIWGCGRRSPAARQWQRREWILCGAKPLPNAVVVPGRTHLGVDLFSPVFQHEMINGVQQLAGVWPRFVNDTKSQLLCHGFTCALARAALNSSRFIEGKKCRPYFFPVLEVALVRGDLLWPGAYDPFAGPYTATLLGGAPPARQRRTVLYATRNHDAYHGKRLVVNESAVVAAVSAAAAAADREFVCVSVREHGGERAGVSAAAVVAAPHGGALAIVFARPGRPSWKSCQRRPFASGSGVSYARASYYAPAPRFSYNGNAVVDPARARGGALRADEGAGMRGRPGPDRGRPYAHLPAGSSRP